MSKIHYFFRPLLAILLMTACNSVFAQTPQKPSPAAPAATKFKPPVVKTTLGKSTDTSSTVTVEEGKEIIALPLKITDEKNNSYTISSYQFSFKRIGIKEDEETGKTSPQTDMVADRFTATPLPEIWRNTIKETLVAGEEFYFFDIIVMDKKGNRFFAPELKIAIQ